MRRFLIVLAGAFVVTFATGGHCNEVSGPTAAMPSVTHIDDNPTRPGSVLIFQGTQFDASATFTLQQQSAVKVTLVNPILATGDAVSGVQVDVTIPVGAAAGTYDGCVTTSGGTGCGPVSVGVLP